MSLERTNAFAIPQTLVVAFAAGLLIAGVARPAGAEGAPAYVTAAIADPKRDQSDAALDPARHPAETLTLIGLKPGDKIVEFIPRTYWRRLFSDVVGPEGHVYLFCPTEFSDNFAQAQDDPKPLPGFSNVSVILGHVDSFTTPEPVDVVWMRQNYHDLYDQFMGPADVPAINRAIYKALKPGGLYVIIDHSAKDGTGIAATETLHRIDAAVVKRDLTEAGFVFVADSNLLRNPADVRDQLSEAPSMINKTDQFFYVFRKP